MDDFCRSIFFLIVLMCATACQRASEHDSVAFVHRPTERDSVAVLHRPTVHVSKLSGGELLHMDGLLPGWRLLKVHEKSDGHWPIADILLIAENGPTAYEIHDLNDLRGLVRITSCHQALAYVRLKTSPNTYTAFPYFENEVMAREDLSALGFYLTKTQFRGMSSLSDGLFGIISRKKMAVGRIEPARCTIAKDGSFLIKRPKLIEGSGRILLVYTLEKVREDGSYAQVKQWPLRTKLSVDWLSIDPLSDAGA